MKKTKILAAITAATLLLSLCSGCGEKAAVDSLPPPEGTAITVTDMMGSTVTLKKPAERVVAMDPSCCEILYAIGAENTLVGRGEYCDYPAQALEVPAVAAGSETNLEQIIALKPDLVLMSDMDKADEQIGRLAAAGIPSAVIQETDIEGVYTAIDLIGTLTGKTENTAALIEGMKATFADIREKSTGDGTQTVYFEVSPLQWGLWTAGSNTFMNEIAGMLGLKNCFEDVDGWGEISEEQVLARDPDFIVTMTMYYGEGPTPEEEILSRTGWKNITAVKNAAVLNLPNNELSRPTPRLADGAQMMFDFVYGE